MAMRSADCQTMIAAFRDANVPLFVAYYRRALPRFLKVKEILEAGRIGQPRAVTVALYRPHSTAAPGVTDWRVNPTVAGGGLFVDMGCHTLDFLDFVLGPIRAANGVAANQTKRYPPEDIVAAHMRQQRMLPVEHDKIGAVTDSDGANFLAQRLAKQIPLGTRAHSWQRIARDRISACAL